MNLKPLFLILLFLFSFMTYNLWVKILFDKKIMSKKKSIKSEHWDMNRVLQRHVLRTKEYMQSKRFFFTHSVDENNDYTD